MEERKSKNIFRHMRKRMGRRFPHVLFLCLLLLTVFVVNGLIFSPKATKPEDLTVVIDAGHGGNDPGKVGVSGVLEKDVNLSIALILKEKLEEKGIRTVMIRENDGNLATTGATNKKSSDMNNRVEMINSVQADCLISIHQNSYPDASVKGAQVFYYGTSEESRELAEQIQKSLIENVDRENHRKAKEGSDYFILRRSVCPGVIVECGFLSCPEETAKLVDEGYQSRLADAIVEAICLKYHVE